VNASNPTIENNALIGIVRLNYATTLGHTIDTLN
jgi:hypothetical protein